MLIEYLADRADLVPELAELHLAEWGHLRPGQALKDRTNALRACMGKSEVPFSVVATNGSELIGSALLVKRDMSTRRDLSPWLAGVFVKPKFRNCGVATRLIQRVEAGASDIGFSTLYLYTDKQSNYYAKRGWNILDSCQYRGIGVTVMSKSL